MKRALLFALCLVCASLVEGANCPTSPTKPTKGVTCQDPVTGYNITRATNWSGDGLSSWTRNDYSRRQAFNADKTRFVTYGPSGAWQLYNASTYARIKTLVGVTGDAELQWHPTDATQFYYQDSSGGMTLKRYDTDDDSTTTVADWTGRLPWGTAWKCSTGSEGSPSSNGRYWGFYCVNSSWAMLGIFTYDLQTDTILATLTTSEGPNYVSMTPTGDYLIVSWWTWQTVQGAEGRTRAYTRDLSDWTWVDCSIEHSDTAVGTNGNDYYIAVDYTAGGGSFTCSPANGYVFTRDIEAGWVSQGLNTARTDIAPMYVSGTTNSVHLSGRATSAAGRFTFSTYACSGGACPTSTSDRLFTANLSGGGVTEAARLNNVYASYWTEPHCSISKDGLKAICNSTWGNSGDEQLDVYIIDLPSTAFIITTTTMPNGTNGQAYQADAQTSGGTQPPTACVTSSGAVPSGATWSVVGNACRLSDASAETGTYNFTLQATDSNSNTDTQAFTLTVNAALQIDTASPMPNGTLSSGYSEQLVCSGGTPPRTFSCCQSGALPTGLMLASNGTFTGTFEQTGVYNFTARCTDNVAATADKALQITVGGGGALTMRAPIIMAGHSYAVFTVGAVGLDYTADCQAIVKDSGGATVETVTSTSGPAVRRLATSVALTAASTYSATFTCSGATPDMTPYPFVTLAAPVGGARTVPLVFGAPSSVLSGAARLTVEYDDNEALSSPATQQNTSCGSGCAVNLSLTAGLYYYRWKWQTAADVVLATSTIQALPVP